MWKTYFWTSIVMPPYEGNGKQEEEEEIVPVDIKSRIAAFSQAPAIPFSSKPAQSPPIPRNTKPPVLKKNPSTSQLLPAWQQQQQQKQQKQNLESQQQQEDSSLDLNFSLKTDQLPSNRPRASTSINQDTIRQASTAFNQDTLKQSTSGESSDGQKLGVKGIIALYGQPQTDFPPFSSDGRGPRSREASLDRKQGKEDNNDTIRRAIPPPALPPRPKSNSAQLSQSNTGSSGNEEIAATGLANTSTTSPPSTYAPYLRKGFHNGSPALPSRFMGSASSSEDLSIDPSHSSLPSSTMKMAPKWASSSSASLTLPGREVSTSPRPAVPPRATASFTTPTTTATPTTTITSSLALPPPKRAPQSPTQVKKIPVNSAQIKISLNTVSSSPIHPIPATSSVSTAVNNTPRSMTKSSIIPLKSSSSNSNSSSNSTVIAPPPRHVDTRRLGATSHVSTSSTSSLRSIRQQKNRKKRAHRAGTIYTRDPGEAEQRYTLLFNRLWKKQEELMRNEVVTRTNQEQLLNKRTVVRLWKQSRLEDGFLAKVWDAALQNDGHGIGKTSFTRAMSAIDFELSNRQEERKARSRT